MFDFLDRLRAKPEGIRKMIALGTVGVFSLLISLVWFSTLEARLGEIKKTEIAYEGKSPIKSISQTASAFWGNVTESFEKGQEAYDKIAIPDERFEANLFNATSSMKEKVEMEAKLFASSTATSSAISQKGTSDARFNEEGKGTSSQATTTSTPSSTTLIKDL